MWENVCKSSDRSVYTKYILKLMHFKDKKIKQHNFKMKTHGWFMSMYGKNHTFSSVQFWSSVRPFATPWITARQASLSITNSQSSLKLMSMPSSHLILCRPLRLLPSIFPSTRVFSSESALLIRWPKYWICFQILLSKKNKINSLIYLGKCWFPEHVPTLP